jgi:transposase-like protein
MTKHSPFRYFKTSPEVIRLAEMLYVRFPLSLRNVVDLLHERVVDVSHKTVRFWWNRFGPMFGTVLVHYRTIEHAPSSCLQRCLSSIGAGWFSLGRGPSHARLATPPKIVYTKSP